MRKSALLLATVLVCLSNLSFAQNIFNPADLANDYPSTGTPAQPAAGQIGHWYRTSSANWNTSQFKTYIYNGMAFRLRFPNNYNQADVSTRYPVILFFHGGGEIGPITDNEHQLLWGAKEFTDSMNAGKFNAFMLFPQLSGASGWDYSYFEKINTILDTLKQYNNIDEDRIISMGLSHGGFGAIYYSLSFPKKTATVIASSPAMVQVFSEESKRDLIHIPLFLANGGRDNNPEPIVVQNFADSFAAKGGDVRHIFLPAQDHGTWLDHWNAGYLVDYWKTAHKANPLIFFQKNKFCPDSAVSVKIGITAGFAQYQWQKNLVNLSGATSNELMVTSFGSYRVRFRRTANGPWSEWSTKPAEISAKPLPPTPDIVVTGVKSKVLPAADGSTSVALELPAGYNGYEWRRVSDNAIVSTERTYVAEPGVYKGYVIDCIRAASNNFTVVNATGNPKPDPAINLTAVRATAGRINLSWGASRVTLAAPTAYEVYRSSTSGGSLTLIAVVPATQKTYVDVLANTTATTLFYRIRAVNETAAASMSNEATATESAPPTAPADLVVVNTGKTYVTLDWTNSTDNVGVTGYEIFVDGVKKYSCVESAITADKLTPGSSYSFTVKAVDAFGNLSAASSTVSSTTPVLANGLHYRFYQGAWDSLPNFNELTYVTKGSTPNANISVRPSAAIDSFGFVWEGYITIPTSGTYSFELGTDDGSKFYWNSLYSPTATPLINNDFAHGYEPTVSKTITVAAGTYPVAITYYEGWGGELMNLYWTGPGIARQRVPDAAFIETAPVFDNQAPSVPSNMRVTYTGKNTVNLAWDNSTDNVGVAGYDLYVNDVLKTTSLSNTITLDTLTASTAYRFKVRARDAAGNISGFSAEAAATTTAAPTGLTYKYYEGSWDSLPNFNTLTPIKTGVSANIDIDVRPVGREDYFAFLWEGKITIPVPGEYTFELSSDDGSKFYFNTSYNPDAVALVNSDGVHGYLPFATGTKTIAAGNYPVAITYFEKWGGEKMELYWSGPGIPRQLVPDAAFTENFKVVKNAGMLSSIDLSTESMAALTPLKVKLFPNPFVSNIRMQINNPASGNHVTAMVTDLSGRIVSRKDFGALSAGTNVLNLNTGTGMKPGVYLVRINVNGLPAGVWKAVKERN